MATISKTTKSESAKNIRRGWHLFDAKGKILGRFVSDITKYLIGKHKPSYVSYLDMGDYVVVINASNVHLTGKKEKSKVYSRYSGYPGGLKQVSFEEMKEKKPEEIIRHAVMGMLPKNKLRDRRITRLFVFIDDKHPYHDKLKIKN